MDDAKEEERLIEKFTRRETPDERRRRIAALRPSPETVAALRRLWQ